MAQRILVGLILVFSIFSSPAWAAEEAAGEDRPTQTIEIRYSPSQNFGEYSVIIDGVVVAIYRMGLDHHHYVEHGGGVGREILKTDHVKVVGLSYLTFGSHGEQWVQPALAIDWHAKPWKASAYVAGFVPLNNHTPIKVLVEPATLEFQLNEQWGLGATLSVVCLEHEVPERKVGPMVRFYHDHGFVEGNYRWLSPHGGSEIQLRLVLELE